MCLLGCDIGSSSIKVSIVDEGDRVNNRCGFLSERRGPDQSRASRMGGAESGGLVDVSERSDKGCDREGGHQGNGDNAIGISYQMHGLVLVDRKMQVLRPSVIWCDSRAVPYGERAFKNIGEKRCLSHLLNSPGNFTASKLAWIKEYEPDIYDRIHKIMLPGDFHRYAYDGRYRHDCFRPFGGDFLGLQE